MSGWGAIYNNASYALSLQTQRMSMLQEQATSGSRVNRASDDPSNAYLILRLKSHKTQLETNIKNLDSVTTSLESTSSVMQGMVDGLTKVKQILTQATSGTYTGNNRAVVSAEVDSILEQAFSFANTQTTGQYLFGGTSTSTPSFLAERQGGKITSVTYQGSDNDLNVPVAPGVQFAGTLVGSRALGGQNPQSPAFLTSATGAAAGTGTASVTGDLWLGVSHGATTYAGSSGVLPAAGSPTGDTILGAHTLTVDAAGLTVRLDNGPAVAFTTADASLKLTASNGDTAYVDMSGWTNFDGLVSLTGSAKLSIDGGATTTTVSSFDHDVAVTDAKGRVLYVDPTGIRHIGADAVRINGTGDIFGTLIAARDMLLNTHSLSESQQAALLQKACDAIDEVSRTVTQQMTSVGARLQAIDTLKTSIEDTMQGDKAITAGIEDADTVQVAADLARTQTAYQMTLSSTARMLNLSLLDFLQ